MTTLRSSAKASRRSALLTAAARLFARSGFNGVSIEDLGSAVGVSGPAVYRHFSSKPAVLSALLVGVSENLQAGGERVIASATDAPAALAALVAFHVDFALTHPDVIRVQDRDLDSLPDTDRALVRSLQRSYVELWVRVLSQINPQVDTVLLRIRAHAVFGLLNSTPHSAGLARERTGDAAVPRARVRALLEQMALAALTPR
ncbi:MAG: TetR/AcrR family transcriptional regulator [Cryobacterium sp.]